MSFDKKSIFDRETIMERRSQNTHKYSASQYLSAAIITVTFFFPIRILIHLPSPIVLFTVIRMPEPTQLFGESWVHYQASSPIHHRATERQGTQHMHPNFHLRDN